MKNIQDEIMYMAAKISDDSYKKDVSVFYKDIKKLIKIAKKQKKTKFDKKLLKLTAYLIGTKDSKTVDIYKDTILEICKLYHKKQQKKSKKKKK